MRYTLLLAINFSILRKSEFFCETYVKMFMFPEPAPFDYYITDVSPSFTADRVFYHGRPIATHKYVAKQLRPIKRTVLHPLAPMQELDARTLDRRLAKEKELYVDSPPKDDGDVYKTLVVMPNWTQDNQRAERCRAIGLLSIFPRSQQYEFWHIQNKRLKDFEHRRRIEPNIGEPCDLLKPSIRWKDESGKSSSLPLGNINDHAFQKCRDFDREDKKFEMDHRLNKDALECVDAFKFVSNRDEPLLKSPPVEIRICSSNEHPCVSYNDTKILNGNSRWYPFHDDLSFPKSDLQREEELRRLTKPFSHDLHTWYSKNKPTKLIIPRRQPGKKAIPEMRFSHL